MKKPREFFVKKAGVRVAEDQDVLLCIEKSPRTIIEHEPGSGFDVIEKSSYQKAIAALKEIHSDNKYLEERDSDIEKTSIVNWEKSGAEYVYLIAKTRNRDIAHNILKDLGELDE